MRAHGQSLVLGQNENHDAGRTERENEIDLGQLPRRFNVFAEDSAVGRPAGRDPWTRAFSRLAAPETKRAASPGGTVRILGQVAPKSTERREPIRPTQFHRNCGF
jgi:hypothetical protein